MKIVGIVACDLDSVIGDGIMLPWSPIPEDMRYFKNQTMGHPVILGRVTAENLRMPFFLENRSLIVLTRDPSKIKKTCSHFMTAGTMEEALFLAGKCNGGNARVFVAGGSSVYSTFYNVLDELDLTIVNQKNKKIKNPKKFVFPWQNLHKKGWIEKNDEGYACFKDIVSLYKKDELHLLEIKTLIRYYLYKRN